MILVQLRIEGIDLSLAKSIVECVVDGGRGDTQSGSSHAIDHQRDCARSHLLIGRDIFQCGQLLQLGDELTGPLIQLVGVRIFERVLILRTADAIVHGDVLHRLHVDLNSRNLLKVILQSANHVGSAHVALVKGFQVDRDPPAIQRRVDAVGSDER